MFGVFVWLLTDNPSVSNPGVMWFCMIATGVMGLFFPLVALWKRLAQRPAVTVLKDRIICYALWKTHIYRFDEVERFRYYKMDLGRTSQEFVTIHLYKQVSERKLQEASRLARAIRRFNTRLSGSQESGSGACSAFLCRSYREKRHPPPSAPSDHSGGLRPVF